MPVHDCKYILARLRILRRIAEKMATAQEILDLLDIEIEEPERVITGKPPQTSVVE